jgi:hypothetical protein
MTMALAWDATHRVRAICRCRNTPRAAPLWALRDTAQWLARRGITLPSTMGLALWRCPRCGHGTVLTVADLRLVASTGKL